MSGAIAIVGMAGRFPGADDVETFWQNVLSDRCSIAPMPRARFDRDRYFDPEIGAYAKSYTDLGGLVSEQPFDGRRFKMTPNTVRATDVAHLWALDVAAQTLEDAGWDPLAPPQTNVGVIVGHARGSMRTADLAFATGIEGLLAGLDESERLRSLGTDRLDALRRTVSDRVRERYGRRDEDGSVGAMTSGLAGLIANAFGLTGRHAVVDAACASSLAAIQLGVNALRLGTLDAALVGGASYSQEVSVVMFAQSRALSPDGSFPFDARASGFVSSDGVGLFLLRRLEDALRDGDNIRAVIRGVGAACDGKGRALWSPQQKGQVLAMRRALDDAGLPPSAVGLVEAHATSTSLGDRIEVEALHTVFGEGRSGPLPIGSVKGNIGHAREAAGAAGMAKAIRALETATLPPTGNLKTPSSEIPWSELAVDVVRSPREWPDGQVRRAGVNAFGIGGLDHHILVEAAPERRPRPSSQPRPKPRALDVAVVGIGVRLPGARTPDELWANLRAGRDMTSRIPAERWDPELYHQPGEAEAYRSYVDRGCFLEDFEPDWRRYKVPPKLVERNDPLQFMVLEAALDAIEAAGPGAQSFDKARAATVVGTVFGSDFALALSEAVRAIEAAEDVAEVLGRNETFDDALAAIRSRRPTINEDSSGSFSSSTLASRVAKTLDLNGPTLTLDAACASSLASIEAACELLASGQADLALAGGGDRAMRVQRFEAYCGIGALSPTGYPRPYDAEADGFVCGEGATMLALVRLDDALAQELPIRAVIRGVGSASEGRRSGMFRPSPEGLATAMRRALSQADLQPDAVGYIEGHGGGTPTGDQAELEAIADVYAPRLARAELGLSTAKAQLGHLQGAAGATGLVQAILTLENRELAPVPAFEKPSAALAAVPGLIVSPVARALDVHAAGVSALGLGGIDVHVVLTSWPGPEERSTVTAREASVARFRGADAASLLASLRRSTPDLERATTESLGEGPAMLAVAAPDPGALDASMAFVLRAGLGEATRLAREKKGIFFDATPPPATKIAFAFSGQGSQYTGMWCEALRSSPAARATFDELDAALQAVSPTPSSLYRDWAAGRPLPETTSSRCRLLVLAADLVAYATLGESGWAPDVVTGHSFGDYAALVAAGAWSVRTALEATHLRASAIREAGVSGGMVALEASARDVDQLLASCPEVHLANANAPDQMVLAGPVRALVAVESLAQTRGLHAQRLSVPGPFHSPLMAPARRRLEAPFDALELRRPSIPYLSSVSGELESDPRTIRQRLVEQLCAPVRFMNQIERLVSEGVGVMVEVGPRCVLTGLAQRAPQRLRAVSSDHPKVSFKGREPGSRPPSPPSSNLLPRSPS